MIKNILLLGAINPGAIENFYTSGFRKCDVEVDRFDIYQRYVSAVSRSVATKVLNKIPPSIFFKPINQDLLQYVDGKFYDAIMVFKGMELFPETIEALKKHTKVIGNFNGDHPFIFFFPGSGNSNITDSLSLYDLHFSYAQSIVERIKTECNKPAFHIPFGYDADATVTATVGNEEFGSNFLFIGAYDPQRAAYMNDLASPHVKIYGDDKWKSRTTNRPYLQTAYQQRSLYGAEYTSAIRNSSGVINILREQNLVEHSHNMRTFEVPGCGGVLLTQRTMEQQEFFEEDKEAIFFDSMDELRSKIDFLARSPDTISKIKQAGYARSLASGYSYDHRSKQMLSHLESMI